METAEQADDRRVHPRLALQLNLMLDSADIGAVQRNDLRRHILPAHQAAPNLAVRPFAYPRADVEVLVGH